MQEETAWMLLSKEMINGYFGEKHTKSISGIIKFQKKQGRSLIPRPMGSRSITKAWTSYVISLGFDFFAYNL